MPEALFITDPEVIKRIEREQQLREDKSATRTATKVILEYFTLVDHGVIPGTGSTEAKRSEPSAA